MKSVNVDHRFAPTVALALLFAASSTAAQTGSALWTTARHDLRRTARSPAVAAHTGTLLYNPRTTGSGAVPSTAAQGPDGSVCFSNGGQLRCVDPRTGTLLWSVAAIGGRSFNAPAIGPDGRVYAVQVGGNQPALVTALNADGTLHWSHATSEIVAYASDLVVDDLGRVFGRYLETAFTQWHVFALDAAGGPSWKTSVAYASEFDPTPPAVLPGGDLVITAIDASSNDRLIRIAAGTGTILWSVVPGGRLSGPLIGDNGLILVHSPGFPPAGGVRAFHPDTGAPAWGVPYFYAEYGEDNPPTLLPGGEIIAIANGDAQGNRLVYRISPDGVLLGTVPYPSTGYYTKAMCGGDGTIYIWTSMRFMAFSPTSGAVLFEYWAAPTSSCLRAPQATILADGSIFASWQRKQTCDSPSSFGEFVTLQDPLAGTPYCIGAGSGTACPCGNASAPAAQAGCLHSSGGAGALRGTGAASTSADTLVLECWGLPATTTALFFQGDAQVNGGAGAVFGDGLRCVGGAVVRLGAKSASGGVAAYPGVGDAPVSVRGAVPPDTTRYYQVWYRNAASFCTPATFNLSNGTIVAWMYGV